jgi:hypothetical protein
VPSNSNDDLPSILGTAEQLVDSSELQSHAEVTNAEGLIVDHPEMLDLERNAPNDFDAEVQTLRTNLATAISQKEAVDMLIALMSPAHHHSPAGLMATRIFNDMYQ